MELVEEVAARYQRLLPRYIRKPMVSQHNISAYAQYTIEIEERDAFQAFLQGKGIPTAVHYPLGLHQQPIFKTLYPGDQQFPLTEQAARKVVSLPMHPYLTQQDQEKVCHVVEEFLSEHVIAN